MSKIMTVCLLGVLLAAGVANAEGEKQDNFNDQGFFLSGQVGYGGQSFGFLDDLFGGMQFQSASGFAARVAAGYQLNRYFSLESGVAYYPSATRDYDSTRRLFGFDGITGQSSITNTFALDVLLGLRLPIGNHFYFITKGGGAAVHYSYGEYIENNANMGTSTVIWGPGSAVFFAPKVVFGAGVKINPKTSIVMTVLDIFSVNGHNPENTRDYQTNLAMATVGITRNF